MNYNPLDHLAWNWTQFCGPDGFRAWHDSHNTIGSCFQELTLQIPILCLFAIVSAYFCGKRTPPILRTPRERNILTLRYLITFFIIMLPLIRCNLELFFKPDSLYPIDVVLAVVQTLAWGVHLASILAIRFAECEGLRGPTLLGSLWILYFVFCCLYVRTQYIILYYTEYHVTYFYFALTQVVLLILYGATMIPAEDHHAERLRHQNFLETQSTDTNRMIVSGYSRFRDDFHSDYLGTALANTGYLSRLTFSWVQPLMSKGIRDKLQCTDDLYDLPVSLSSSYLYEKMLHALAVTRIIEADPIRPSRDEGRGYAQVPRPSLLRALHYCYGYAFYACGGLKVISDLAGFAAPLLLYHLVDFIETGTAPIEQGAMYAGGLTLATLIAAFSNEHFVFQMTKVSLKIRGSLVTIIYKKTLNLSVLTLNSISVGEIVNHISTDTDRIVGACASFHACWSIPFQLVVTLYLLYLHLGVAAFTGVVFSLLLIPVNKLIADKIASFSNSNMSEKDERVRLMSEILLGIRSIKLYAWEKFFIERINQTRARELYYLKWRKYLDALCVYFWATTPVTMSLTTFSTYVMLGNPLTAATVFTSMALLNMLIGPLNAFPWVLNGLMEAWVSVKRIQKLLNLPETDHTAYYSHINKLKSRDTDDSVIIRNATFTWHSQHFIMSHVSACVPRAKLTGVCGPVGAGKSSLLMAICGEIDKQSGVLALGPEDMENGFSLVTQTPWLQHATVRDNILFGLPYNESFYNTVLEACALKSDFQCLSVGDLTMVGEGGLTLSGGQKARLSLARAVYQNKTIFLLDDILSALDATVASHVFSQCVHKLLLGRGKTVVMATHLTQYLVSAHHVLVLASGCLVAQGTPAQVLPNYNDLVLGMTPLTPDAPPLPDEKNSSRSSSLTGGVGGNEEFQEILCTGTLSLSVYAAYIRGVGTVMSLCVLVFLVTMQLTKNGGDWWFAYWLMTQNQTDPVDPVNSTTTEIENLPSVIHMVSLIQSHLPPSVSMNFSNFLFIFCLIGTLNSFTALGRAFTFAIGGIKGATKLHDQLLNSIMKAPVLMFDLCPSGQILNRFSSDVNTIDDSLPFILNILLASLFSVLGATFIIGWSLPWLIVVLLPLIPIYHRLQNHYRYSSRQLKRISSISLSPLYSHFNETLQGITSVRAFRAVGRFMQECEDKLEANQKARFSAAVIQNWLGLRLQLIGVAVVTGVGVVAMLQHWYQIANPALVGLAISYSLSLTSVLNSLINSMTETEKELVAVERVNEYIHIKKEEDVFGVRLPHNWPSSGVVQFSNVQLRYRSNLSLSLKSVSFESMPNEKIGIVGRTGAGKSSLLVALFRLTEICAGTIYVDEINIANVPLTELRSRFFVIPQDPFLFSGTIRQNLDPNDRYRDSEIWTALQRCHLIPVVKKLGGLNAPLSHDGTNLSNGQKQLMCLVRALLQNAKILFIDEATASVDQDTDWQIQNTIRSCFLHSTVFIIAHRIHSVLSCDRVLVMSDGKVIEFDSPQTLRQDTQSAFYSLVTQSDSCS
uniref:ABC-type xenobiotic transporter n=2 Tax=Cacopsylla melanoneura TaxID=428564 RepID=A0A8D9EWB0_9HEMI